jgi:hypothetical protein
MCTCTCILHTFKVCANTDVHTRTSTADATPTVATPTASTPTAATPTAETPTAETPTAATPTVATTTAATPTAATPTVPSTNEAKGEQTAILAATKISNVMHVGEPQGTHKLIISPHCDDAIVSLGGMIARNPANITIVTVFTKNLPTPRRTKSDRLAGFADSRDAVLKRIAEHEQAVQFMNAGLPGHDAAPKTNITSAWGVRIIKLEYLEHMYRGFTPEGLEPPELMANVSRDVCKLIGEHVDMGVAVKVYAPIGFLLSRQSDHEHARKAALVVSS